MTNKHEQLSFEEEHTKADNESVVCLGMTFKNDDERREYFRNELRKKLPELKKIEGFPIGEDEDIIELSDPPYYTACPNPWINDFIEEWERNKVEKFGRDLDEEYHKELFASDIKEGKNDRIYNAHSYHTKVPYKAIMRYILHYTKPGDIVFDGFAGSGMTGVASQLCGSETEVKELNADSDSEDEKYSKDNIGKRNAVLMDLSTAGTFLSYGYNRKTSDDEKIKLERSVHDFIQKYEWLFFTIRDNTLVNKLVNKFNEIHINELEKVRAFFKDHKKYFGKVNYVVWSNVYYCHSCASELTFYDINYDPVTRKVLKKKSCEHCGANLKIRDLERVFITKYDHNLNKTINIPKEVPVLINYTYNKKRYEKKFDSFDNLLVEKITQIDFNHFLPKDQLPEGEESSRPKALGIENVSLFYSTRNLFVLSTFLEDINVNKWLLNFLHGSVLPRLTKLNRYMPQHGSRALVGPMTNAFYFPPLYVENNSLMQIKFQLNKVLRALFNKGGNTISTQSSSSLMIKDNSIDYIFLDPPFGNNIMYSELSFIRESWLKVKTNNELEAIENKVQHKTLDDYTEIIKSCLKEAYRILKPGRWITIEFSNTKATVWNAIQQSILGAGFVIASVDALDKKRGGFHAMITTTAVKQDLVISAYKPKKEDIERITRSQNTVESTWNFINQHLEQLPIFIGKKGAAEIISERTPRILFDRMIAYHIQNGLPVPISSSEFQMEISQRYPMRDGMVFLENQVAEYDKKRILVSEFSQMNLFVSDENSAIEWLRQQLMKKPQSRQDIHPNFMKEIQHIERHELLPELDDLLNQNFLIYQGEGAVPDQIVAYFRRNYKDLRGLEPDDEKVVEKAMNRWYVPDPNKQADLERLRERALLREFEGYLKELESHRRQLCQFRTEAIRAGFKKAYSDRNFEQIIQVGDRLPKRILEADDKLLMYYDNASIRLGM